jgi:hypothetical protein
VFDAGRGAQANCVGRGATAAGGQLELSGFGRSFVARRIEQWSYRRRAVDLEADRRRAPDVLRAVERRERGFEDRDCAADERARRWPAVEARPLLFARRLRCRPSAVSRATSLLKLLSSPRAVLSWTSSASLFPSKLLNHSRQEIGCSRSPPLHPGKSRRIIPVSPLRPVPLTHAGCAFRDSAQRRIAS